MVQKITYVNKMVIEQAWILIVERNYELLTSTLFLVKVVLFLFETKMMNGLKFKTRETATTTSPFYTRRHREHFNVRKTT